MIFKIIFTIVLGGFIFTGVVNMTIRGLDLIHGNELYKKNTKDLINEK